MTKRLLVLSVSAGAGHNRAAEAIDASAKKYFPDVSSQWHDALNFTTRWFKTVYSQSYMVMVNHMPSVWGLLYHRMGEHGDRKKLNKLVKAYDQMAYKRLMRMVDRFQPDAILCTHFLPPNVILTHKGGERYRVPVGVVITDFDVHSFWVNPDVSVYYVASEEVKWQATRYGIPEEKIVVTGIPVHPAFSERKGRARLQKDFGLRADRKTLLVVSGGFGVGDVESAVASLLKLDMDFQMLVISGKNEKLRKKLAALCKPHADRVQVFGFVRNIQDFMEASDAVVTKAGGLTVSECLAVGVPMIITSPIPGQEERNCDFLMEQGAAIKAKNLDVLDFKVRELLSDDTRLSAMRSAAQRVARPHAGREIIEHISHFAR